MGLMRAAPALILIAVVASSCALEKLGELDLSGCMNDCEDERELCAADAGDCFTELEVCFDEQSECAAGCIDCVDHGTCTTEQACSRMCGRAVVDCIELIDPCLAEREACYGEMFGCVTDCIDAAERVLK